MKLSRRRRPRREPALQGLHALQELAGLRDALARQQREAAAQAAREQAQREQAERQRRLFADAVGPVCPLPDRGLALVARARPAPLPLQRQADERAALAEALSDEVDVDSLLLTDDGLSYRRPEVPPDVVSRLRRGQWTIQSQLDLHGLRRDEAREQLAQYVREATRRGERCVRVVHGKGHGSPGREPVLKSRAQRWLAQCRQVMAFTQASGPQGGAGALIVLLSGKSD